MKTIKLKITTPERVVSEMEIEQITLPTEGGQITILPNHVPLLGVIVPGMIEVKSEGEISHVATGGGFLEFHDNEITLLSDTAERADEIDLERAEAARKKAKEMMKDKRMHSDEEQFASVVSGIEKQLARIKVAKKYRPHKAKRTNLSQR